MTTGLKSRVQRLEDGRFSPRQYYPGQPFGEIAARFGELMGAGDLVVMDGYFDALQSEDKRRLVSGLSGGEFDHVPVHPSLVAQLTAIASKRRGPISGSG